MVVEAIGVDLGGKKTHWGWRGTTENAAACKALLKDLIQRGLAAERSLLFVIDRVEHRYHRCA